MKSVGLLGIFVLLLSAHYDDSIPLHGVGGSFQSQSHHQWPPNRSQPATVMKMEYSLPHGPDSAEWTFHEHWFQVSFVLGIVLVILAVILLLACIAVVISTLTFVGLSAVVDRIQPTPTCHQQTGITSL